MSELAQALLSDLPQEEVINTDVGMHEDTLFDGADVGTTKNGGFQAIARFSVNRNGRGVYNHREYINLPQQDSHPVTKQMALGWYRALGIVPQGNKNIPLVSDRDSAEKLVSAINTNAGTKVGISLSEDDNGFLRARPLRRIVA
jgi:hypothetical protein